MLSTLAGIDDSGSRKGLKEWTDGVKSIRIITSETDSEELRRDAVTMLKATARDIRFTARKTTLITAIVYG